MNVVLAERESIFSTIQGEGKYIGYPTTFIRQSACNLRCSWSNKDGTQTRCDTPYTSFNPEKNKRSVDEVVKEVKALNIKHVCLSGGEPFLQPSSTYLIDEMVKNDHFVTVETNGTIFRESDANFISLSPKLSSSCSDTNFKETQEARRLNYDALCKFVIYYDYQFKFVINDQHDIGEALEIINTIQDMTGQDLSDKIWVMPQGITPSQFDEKLKWLADECVKLNWKLTDRFHIRIWKGEIKR